MFFLNIYISDLLNNLFFSIHQSAQDSIKISIAFSLNLKDFVGWIRLEVSC